MTKPPQLTRSGTSFIFTWQEEQIMIEVRNIREHKSNSNVTSEITVTTTNPAYNPHLIQQGFNLTSAQTRTKLAATLKTKYKEKVDWDSLIEQLCVITLREYRKGEELQMLVYDGTINQVIKPEYLIEPLVYKNMPNMLYGDGGTCKSYLATYCCLIALVPELTNGISLHAQHAKPLILDYEFEKNETEARWQLLANGLDVPPVEIPYRRCHVPLVSEFDVIAKIIKENDCDFIIIDSLGLAAGSDSLKEERAALDFYKALRQLSITSLLIHHISKDESNKSKPFGSVYFRNMARYAWEIRNEQEAGEDELIIGLFNRKNNLGKYSKPLSLKFKFYDDMTTVHDHDVKQVLSFQSQLSTAEQIIGCLKGNGLMTPKEISEVTLLPYGTVKTVCNRMAKRNTLVTVTGRYGIATGRVTGE